MDGSRTGIRNIYLTNLILILSFSLLVNSCEIDQTVRDQGVIETELKKYVDSVFSVNEFSIVPGVRIEEVRGENGINRTFKDNCSGARSLESMQDYVDRKIDQFAEKHTLSVNLPQTARFFFSSGESNNTESGKSSFLTGFGMGFLAFGLKKLMLPFFIGVQLIKSVLIAMFLPSLLGGLGKIVGKGLSTFSGISGASTGLKNHQNQLEDFEFKDVDPYKEEAGLGHDFNAEAAATNNQLAVVANPNENEAGSTTNSRHSTNQRISFVSPHSDNYYIRRPDKKTDYKVFHKIPSSSLLLTSYDPFYSPLLSRLDAIFQQLGLGNGKSAETERCRERLICLMYANPTKYAPYSNLVSAQLSRFEFMFDERPILYSNKAPLIKETTPLARAFLRYCFSERELNELRKPSSDNADILRFFKYMKAAKDGQDGEKCLEHGGCPSLSANKPSPAMITTFNDINKLVMARNLKLT